MASLARDGGRREAMTMDRVVAAIRSTGQARVQALSDFPRQVSSQYARTCRVHIPRVFRIRVRAHEGSGAPAGPSLSRTARRSPTPRMGRLSSRRRPTPPVTVPFR